MFENTAQPDANWWHELWPDPATTLDTLGVTGGSLLDCCSGTGHFTVAAADRCRPTYALDIDEELLKTVTRRAYEANVTVETLAGDAMAAPDLLPDPVETVLLFNTFHGVPDQTGLAHALRNCLTDDGRLVVVNWHDYRPMETVVQGESRGPPKALRMTPEETRRAVEPAGFRAVETVELEPFHYGVIFERQ